MKRAAIIVLILIMAVWVAAQTSGSTQQTPAAGQSASQSTPAQGAAAQPAGKRPPQAKTQPEFDAYKAAAANTDAAGLEKAADDFAAKFADSELRVLLYKTDMHLYQNTNNAEKTEDIGRKVLAIDPDDPDALTTVAEVIAERTRDTDINRDQRYTEGLAMAQKALTTIDSDVAVPAGTPQDKVDAYKAGLRSQAYSTMGTIEYNKTNYPGAQEDFQKAIDAFPSQPYAPDVLRLALSLDKQGKYEDALKAANRAVELSQESSGIGGSARREQDRLQKLTGKTPAIQPQTLQTPPQGQPAQTPPQGQPPKQ
ncbi:MAG TPA: tetratricopeptide repeat protein [Terriglobales bacterium]|nr:tetratricopeptide repeat protein [Terriglobales bacterium]